MAMKKHSVKNADTINEETNIKKANEKYRPTVLSTKLNGDTKALEKERQVYIKRGTSWRIIVPSTNVQRK